MADSPFVPLGRVVKVHGVKGEVSVAFASGPPFALPDEVEVWIVPPIEGPESRRVQTVRPGPKGPLVKLSGIDDRVSAERLRNRTLMVRRDVLPPDFAEPPPDLAGVRVVDVDRGLIGTIEETIVTGANDVWIVNDGPFGQVLIPVIDDVVLDFDESAEEVRVRLLPGLIDESHEAD